MVEPGYVCGFGVRISSFSLPWRVPDPAPFHISLKWSSTRAPVMGDPLGWRREERDGIIVGWGGYAEYRVVLEPEPHAEATIGPIPVQEAAVGFVFSVLPLALPLFDLEPLHGSSVAVGEGAMLLLGPRGAGKSSLAAALESVGFGLLSDDACAIDGTGQLWPGPPFLNPRWGDAHQPVIGSYNGKDVRAPSGHRPEPRAVAGVLSLVPAQGIDLGVRTLAPAEALLEILANIRAPDVFVERRRGLQLSVAALLSGRAAGTISYDPQRHRFDQVADAVAEWSERIG